MNAIPALDGLRAVAVLLVLMDHVWQSVFVYFYPGQSYTNSPLYYGKSGVQLFFVLSGFLLFLPYAEWLFGLRPRPSALLFYKRRALRVGPAYWVSLVILIAAAPLTLAAFQDLAVHLFFLSNLTNRTALSINGVYWTMAVEVQFYATLPLIGWAMKALAQKMQPGSAAGLVLLSLLMISFLSLRLGLSGHIASMPLVSPFLVGVRSLPYWLAVFGGGILCSLAYIYLTRIVKLTRQETQRLRNACNVTFFLGIALALACACIPALQHSSEVNLLFGLAAGGFLFAVVLGGNHLRAPFASKPMRFLGLISYSFYIWHNIVVGILAPHLRFLPFVQQWFALYGLSLVASLLVAYLSYQVSERPFIKARKRAHEGKEPAQKEPAPLPQALETNAGWAAQAAPARVVIGADAIIAQARVGGEPMERLRLGPMHARGALEGREVQASTAAQRPQAQAPAAEWAEIEAQRVSTGQEAEQLQERVQSLLDELDQVIAQGRAHNRRVVNLFEHWADLSGSGAVSEPSIRHSSAAYLFLPGAASPTIPHTWHEASLRGFRLEFAPDLASVNIDERTAIGDAPG